MIDFKNLKEVLEYAFGPEHSPADTKKLEKYQSNTLSDFDMISLFWNRSKKDEKILKSVEKGAHLTADMLAYLEIRLKEETAFERKYQDACQKYLAHKEFELHLMRDRSIYELVKENDPEIYAMVTRQKKRQSLNRPIITVFKELDGPTVRLDNWKSIYGDIHKLSGANPVVFSREMTHRAYPRYSTAKVTHPPHILDGEITKKETKEDIILAGELELNSSINSFALLLSNGMNIKVISGKSKMVKLDNISLEEDFDISLTAFAVLDHSRYPGIKKAKLSLAS